MTTFRKSLVLVVLLLANIPVMSCDVCKKQQPDFLRGITHGAGPQSNWDYVAVWCMVIIVMISLFYGIKSILRPGEKEREHIKRSILNLD